jgi:phosphoribosylanthranilate isomerase
MCRVIVQIYEVQTPAEAEEMISLNIDHIGSVILDEMKWKVGSLKDTVDLVRGSDARSSLIPLFSNLDSILRLLDYYQPDIIHFCEDIGTRMNDNYFMEHLIKNQVHVKEKFPEIMVMRSIPVVPAGGQNFSLTLESARIFETASDYFLTDTFLVKEKAPLSAQQPVNGFIGITGKPCNWEIAARLVRHSNIPVILAGGISADNVYDGITQVRPAGVDSCTETNVPGRDGQPIRFRKDACRVKRLVDEVRRAEQSFRSN